MHKKYHKKFKILDILAVTTQAREGIETTKFMTIQYWIEVTTQAREGIETTIGDFVKQDWFGNNSSPRGH